MNMKNIIVLFSTMLFFLVHWQAYAQCDPCQPLSSGVIDNGDFSDGGDTFNSDLNFTCNCSNDSYCIVAEASDLNCSVVNLPPLRSSDHSDYMIIRSSDINQTLWNNELPIFVEPNTEYHLSFKIFPNIDGSPNIPKFRILINNQPFQNPIIPIADEWQQICFTWFSGANQSINLSIIQEPSAGSNSNFIGLDDINLRKVLPEAIDCKLMVQYDAGTSQSVINDIRNSYSGILVEDLCACGNIDLWDIPGFPINLPDGTIIFDIEDLRKDSNDEAGVQSSDYNYVTQTPNISSSTANINNLPQHQPEADVCGVTVAVIDTGVDKCHPALSDDMWSDCNACPAEATEGYNYAYNNTNFYDDSSNGHGTHVAGIVNAYYNAYNLNQSTGVNIMPVKAMDSSGHSSLFEIVCATHYAIENGADVINMSFGYRGDSTEMLYNAIEYAKITNEIVVVTSVGNDGLDNDTENHYPSNHSNSNLIAVAADSSAHELAPYSAYGMNNVDISVEGRVESAIPIGIDIYDDAQDGYTILVGTSMAAPQIAAAAAMTKQYHYDSDMIKDRIFSAGIPLAVVNNPTLTNASFDFPMLQNILSGTETCSGCCGPLSSCEVSCNPCNLDNDFCYDVDVRNVYFDNNSVSNGSMTHFWDFGDGASSTDIHPNHTFPSVNAPTTYSVCLTTTSTMPDGTTCCKTCCDNIIINPPCYNNIPGPDFNVNTRSNGNVVLANPSGAGNAYTKTWTIDGVFYSNLNQPPVVNNLSVGVHEVCLEVSRNSNPTCNEKVCKFIYVNDPCSVPTVAKFAYGGCMDSGQVFFQNTSSGTNANTIYEWDFGDDTGGSGEFINHTFPNPGTYLVCLTIHNGQCSKRVCHMINLSASACDENCMELRHSAPDLQKDNALKDVWNEGGELQILPNPAQKIITAVFGQINVASAQLTLRDTKGQALRQLVLKKGVRNVQIDISDLPTGVYILSLSYPDGKVASAKVVKE